MEEKSAKKFDEEALKSLPVRSEDIGFAADAMIDCAKCARRNPPTRLKCVYCGAQLELSAAQLENLNPALRKLENWEKGFNLIYLSGLERVADLSELAKTLRIEKEFLSKIVETGKPLPLARAEAEAECAILQKNLQKIGVETKLVGDQALAAETLPKRLRRIEFDGQKLGLVLFNADEIIEFESSELCLIVSGVIFEKAVEAVEKRKKGETKILDATETASDEFLVDIYTKNDPHGFRILTKGFDFSCLGAEKGLLARDNLNKLVEKLRRCAPDVKFVGDYLQIRSILGEVWEIEQRKDSQGLKRQSFGRFELANVASSNNLQQFTKYSRLQWQIL